MYSPMSPSPQQRDYILLFDIEGNTFTSMGRTLPCGPHHNTKITLLFNTEGNTFTSEGCTLPCLHHLNTGIISYSLILRVTHLHPKDVLSHVSITSTPGLYLLFDIKSSTFTSEGCTLPCLHHLNTGIISTL